MSVRELNLGPLQEQEVTLTIGPSLQPLISQKVSQLYGTHTHSWTRLTVRDKEKLSETIKMFYILAGMMAHTIPALRRPGQENYLMLKAKLKYTVSLRPPV